MQSSARVVPRCNGEPLRRRDTLRLPQAVSYVTVVQPAPFRKVANGIASLFAMASSGLNQIRAHKLKNDWVTALLVALQLVMLVLLVTGQIR